jgi:hypothetical protein|tara:strand:+ start:728 stop:1105 length:378 start_codon:yes stop_codon:yes gene_type:complete
MARLAFLIINSFIIVSIVSATMYSQAYATKESKLGTVYSATTWGAGIGIVAGLGIAALETPDTEEKGETSDRIKCNVLQGFGAGVLVGLIYGMFEISEIGPAVSEFDMSYDINAKKTIVAYNYKF